jgi:hypothetical protein
MPLTLDNSSVTLLKFYDIKNPKSRQELLSRQHSAQMGQDHKGKKTAQSIVMPLTDLAVRTLDQDEFKSNKPGNKVENSSPDSHSTYSHSIASQPNKPAARPLSEKDRKLQNRQNILYGIAGLGFPWLVGCFGDKQAEHHKEPVARPAKHPNRHEK